MPYQCLRRFRCNGIDYQSGDLFPDDAVDPRRRLQMESARMLVHVEGTPKRKPGRPKGAKTRKRAQKPSAKPKPKPQPSLIPAGDSPADLDAME